MLLPLLEVFVGIFSNSSSCSQYGANETVIIGILPRLGAADGLSQVVILFQSFIHLGKMKNQNNLIRYVELNVNMYVQGDVSCLFSASRTKPRRDVSTEHPFKQYGDVLRGLLCNVTRVTSV